MSIHLNYHNYWGNYYTWLSIYISEITKILKIVKKNVLFFLHFSVFFIKKNVWGYPCLKAYKKNSIENMPHFFHILNVNMYMMLLVCCFRIFDKKERKVKKKLGHFFHKMKIKKKKNVPTNIFNVNPYLGFR